MSDHESQNLGRYQIIEELGGGGFGKVFKANDSTLDRAVALKVLAPHLAWQPDFVMRFQHEARIAASLRHSNIVTIYEVGEDQGSHYIAMEYLPGLTLAKLIMQEGALAPDRVVSVVERVASALDYAHGRNLVHRDVKPSNIIVGPEGQVTLTDFGLVKAAAGTKFTTTGQILGTPEYMSPEQAEALGVDWRSNIYSLGVVAFEMCTGTVPFSGKSHSAIL